MTQQFIADASFWQLFPQAQLAVLILDNINNQGESSPAVKQLLAEANIAAKKHLTAEQLSQNPAVAAWLARQKQHAEQDLRDLFFRLPQIKRQDPAAAKIIRLFARSVRRFAEKRYPKRFGGG